MLQDLYPHIYHNEMAWKAPAPDDYALIFAPDGTVYCDLTDGALTLPRIRDVGPGGARRRAGFPRRRAERPAVLTRTPCHSDPDDLPFLKYENKTSRLRRDRGFVLSASS